MTFGFSRDDAGGFLQDYYDKDLSLSEIAQNQEITRQAVRDIIKKG